MHRHITALAVFALVLAGCGSNTPTATSPSASRAPGTPARATHSSPATSSSASARPPAPPSSNVKNCFEGDCTLLLTSPVTIPLDAAKLHYASMDVTAISTESLTYTVSFSGGGGSEQTIGPGLDGGSFGFRGSPSVEVGLTVVGGKPALVLQLGPITS